MTKHKLDVRKNSNHYSGYFHYLVGSMLKGSDNEHIARALNRALALSLNAKINQEDQDKLTDNQCVMQINHWYYVLGEDLSIVVELRDREESFVFSPNIAAWWKERLEA